MPDSYLELPAKDLSDSLSLQRLCVSAKELQNADAPNTSKLSWQVVLSYAKTKSDEKFPKIRQEFYEKFPRTVPKDFVKKHYPNVSIFF